jgi:hypothetical protein
MAGLMDMFQNRKQPMGVAPPPGTGIQTGVAPSYSFNAGFTPAFDPNNFNESTGTNTQAQNWAGAFDPAMGVNYANKNPDGSYNLQKTTGAFTSLNNTATIGPDGKVILGSESWKPHQIQSDMSTIMQGAGLGASLVGLGGLAGLWGPGATLGSGLNGIDAYGPGSGWGADTLTAMGEAGGGGPGVSSFLPEGLNTAAPNFTNTFPGQQIAEAGANTGLDALPQTIDPYDMKLYDPAAGGIGGAGDLANMGGGASVLPTAASSLGAAGSSFGDQFMKYLTGQGTKAAIGAGVNAITGGGGAGTGSGGTGNLLGDLFGAYTSYTQGKSAQDDWARQIKQIEDLYSPDSAYSKQMQEALSRKDAAAGRNSQYGDRAVELAAKLTDSKASALTNANYSRAISNMIGARNQFPGTLNSLFQGQLGSTINGAITGGANTLWDWIKNQGSGSGSGSPTAPEITMPEMPPDWAPGD